jgi:hypothetical protein
MDKYVSYARYLIRHKWFVFVAGRRLKAPLWRLIIHDWTKLLPQEWFAYMHYFYGSYPPWEQMRTRPYSEWVWSKEAVAERFQRAWLHHIHWNKHHWQYWVLMDDPSSSADDRIGVLQIPDSYIREMVADWLGAGRAIRGGWEAGKWYEERKDMILLHSITRAKVEWLLEKAAAWRD